MNNDMGSQALQALDGEFLGIRLKVAQRAAQREFCSQMDVAGADFISDVMLKNEIIDISHWIWCHEMEPSERDFWRATSGEKTCALIARLSYEGGNFAPGERGAHARRMGRAMGLARLASQSTLAKPWIIEDSEPIQKVEAKPPRELAFEVSRLAYKCSSGLVGGGLVGFAGLAAAMSGPGAAFGLAGLAAIAVGLAAKRVESSKTAPHRERLYRKLEAAFPSLCRESFFKSIRERGWFQTTGVSPLDSCVKALAQWSASSHRCSLDYAMGDLILGQSEAACWASEALLAARAARDISDAIDRGFECISEPRRPRRL